MYHVNNTGSQKHKNDGLLGKLADQPHEEIQLFDLSSTKKGKNC